MKVRDPIKCKLTAPHSTTSSAAGTAGTVFYQKLGEGSHRKQGCASVLTVLTFIFPYSNVLS